jgi:OOP family OmpA-OmpF porin
MSVSRVLFTLLILAAFAATASATVPTSAECRDPEAPCYAWPAVDYDRDGVFDRVDNCPGTPKGCLVDPFGCHMDSDGDKVCDGVDECPNTPAGEKVNKVGCSASQLEARKQAAAPPPPPPPAQEVKRPETPPPPPTPPESEVERELVETGSIVLRNVYFEFDKATLLPESESILNEAGAALEKFADLEIEVQGHTDSRGSDAYNEKLSQARAEAVRDYLLKNFHLSSGKFAAKGYGEGDLLVSPENTEDDYAMNRRVVLKVLNPDVLPRGVKVEEQK